jgi:hypothetical protein
LYLCRLNVILTFKVVSIFADPELSSTDETTSKMCPPLKTLFSPPNY